MTTVYVTHDRAEAMTLGHRVAVLRDARLPQCDTPRALYERPADTFAAGFIVSPSMNLCTLPVTNGGVALGGASAPVPRSANGRPSAVLGLRPESLELTADGVPARVEVVEELGADAYVFCAAGPGGGETKLLACGDARHASERGARLALRPRPDEAHLFDPETDERLG